MGDTVKKIPLTQGKFALVDDEDFEYLIQFRWFYHKLDKDKTGYAIRNSKMVNYKRTACIRMHREVLGLKPGQLCDHIDGNGINNQKNNLRICDSYQNAWNKRTASNKKLKAIKGVTRVKDRNGKPAYWIARITVRKNRIYLGVFKTKKLAEEAYKNAAIKYHGEFARW
jgi:hypothetical protein